MESTEENNQCCFGCLCTEEFGLKQFSLQNEPLKAIFQVDSIVLCIFCKRIAQHAELFIQNVQSNQIVLQNFHNDLSSVNTTRSQIQPCTLLAPTPLQHIELSGTGSEESCSIITSVSCLSAKLNIKLELKDEVDQLGAEYIDGTDDFQDPYIKEENLNVITTEDFPLNLLLKEELEESYGSSLSKEIRKKLKKKEGKEKNTKLKRNSTNVPQNNFTEPPDYIRLHITEKQCMKEREKRMQEDLYMDSTFKCEDCIKGFMLEDAFDRHMTRHSLNRGSFICTVCKQRFETLRKLNNHKRCHFNRYKCSECDVVRGCIRAMREHYANKHNGYAFQCGQCPKLFSNKASLRKHERYTHSGVGRVVCSACNKSYFNKDSLLAHILRKHPPGGAGAAVRRRHACARCGARFAARAQLAQHAAVHSERRAYYCVECDRSFKTAAVLKQHLKTAMPHINYLELPLCCEHCGKRFSIKRDLERHMNRVHLNIKPFPCDKCDKAYVNNWSLRDHKRYNHDGVKRPLRYPCTMCDKVFDRSSILKAHVRTHTGERPYHCEQCPAQFAQSSALGTHVKLVHLKLTRDGRPKQASMK